MIRTLLRDIYHRVAPSSVQRALKPLLHPFIALARSQVLRHASGAVISGPFKGLKFGNAPLSLPIVLGTYELELHGVFARLANTNFSRIIDVGAAEGYYAVGTALWKPTCKVVAYEANPIYHKSIQHLAQTNNVQSRLDIKGTCETRDLHDLGDDLIGALLIVDVEGYEKTLLDPREIPALRSATILVETHDNFVPGCEATIKARFMDSHAITEFQSRARVASECPIKTGLARFRFMDAAFTHCISDGRTEPNGWLLLEPRL